MATLAASLFNSLPTVSAGPLNASRSVPSALDTTGFGITNDSSNHALRMVTHAPATVAWPAPYDGCVGQPSGAPTGSRYVPFAENAPSSAAELRTSELMGYV